MRLSVLTDKDKADLAFGLRAGVDYVALSFVREAEDVRLLVVAMSSPVLASVSSACLPVPATHWPAM